LIHTAVRDGNVALASGELTAVADRLGAVLAMTAVLGINPLDWQRPESTDLLATVDSLVRLALQAREDARARRDYAAADGIRDQLGAAGVVVEDTPSGPRWTLKGR
jgi:cysteinyl-tRNA synthetase